MIGSNNMFLTPETGIKAAARGLELCVKKLREKFPDNPLVVTTNLPAHQPGHRFHDDILRTNAALLARKLDAPHPNLLSARFPAWEKSINEALAPVVVDWLAGLPAERQGLFVGWKCGWETMPNSQSAFFKDGNADLDRALLDVMATCPVVSGGER